MILEIPSHTIVAYTEQQSEDSYGNSIVVPSTEDVEVRCRITPMSTTRDRVTSRVDNVLKVITADLSTIRWIRVRLDDKWFTVDEWKCFDSSPSTAHIEATIREES